MIGEGVSSDVRAQFAARIDSFGQRLGRGTPADLRADLNVLRSMARAHRNAPALAVIATLDSAIARGERGPVVIGGLGVLRDAIGSGRVDEQAASVFAAACSVRLAGG